MGRNTNTTGQKALPMEVEVRVYPVNGGGNLLANASITLNGCFAIRDVKILRGKDGPFVGMPSRKTRDGYQELCFPVSKDFRERLYGTVLREYEQTVAESQRQNEPEPCSGPTM